MARVTSDPYPPSTDGPSVRAPRGAALTCKGWAQEAAMRMLMNSFDDEVANRPREQTVHGGPGKTARNLQSYHATVHSLQTLSNDETLLVRSGKPVAIFRTHPWAPRVLIADASRVGHDSNEEASGTFEPASLKTPGQTTAGNWMNIGAQGVLQTTYETFAAAARKHFRGDLTGRLIVSGGMGEMGGAQPLAASLNGAAFLGVEVDAEKIKRCLRAGYCDIMVTNLDEALRILKNAVRQKNPASVGLVGNCAEVIPELARRGLVPDLLTDQTSAQDPMNGYIPEGLSVEEAARLRERAPDEYLERAYDSIAHHVEGMLALQKLGAATFDYGNDIRAIAFEHRGLKDAYDIPDFVSAYLRPLFCEGRAPVRWVALSGEPSDIYRADDLALELFRDHGGIERWIRLARKHVKFQGLPARICWLGYGERAHFGKRLNDLVARGEVKAPMVMGRDNCDCGLAASPFRETEAHKNGSGVLAEWPILNALLNTASGASWVSIQCGGAGIGDALHTGQATVADGMPEMAERIERVMTNDPGIGIARLGDVGDEEASAFARSHGVKIPMLESLDS